MKLGHDLKQYGCEPRMPPMLTDLCLALVAIIGLLTVYSMVADTPDRQVVVTTRASIDKQIAAERIRAAQEIMDAVGTCGWRDQFSETPRVKRGAM